ncbi:hypothetical protein F7U66_01455 [Vibrio parahaemolyticus]|nr:hypothetical protein [Vibrio parahaemolyticus]
MNRERKLIDHNGFEVWLMHVEDDIKRNIVGNVARILEFRFDEPQNIPLALLHEGKQIGFLDVIAKYHREYEDYNDSDLIHYPSTFELNIELVAIDEKYRGNGLSKLLQDGLLKLLESRNYFDIQQAPKLESLAITYHGAMFINMLLGRIRNRLPRSMRNSIKWDVEMDMPTEEYFKFKRNAEYPIKYHRSRYDELI